MAGKALWLYWLQRNQSPHQLVCKKRKSLRFRRKIHTSWLSRNFNLDKEQKEAEQDLVVKRFAYDQERDAVRDAQVREDQRIENRKIDVQQMQAENQHAQAMGMQQQMRDIIELLATRPSGP